MPTGACVALLPRRTRPKARAKERRETPRTRSACCMPLAIECEVGGGGRLPDLRDGAWCLRAWTNCSQYSVRTSGTHVVAMAAPCVCVCVCGGPRGTTAGRQRWRADPAESLIGPTGPAAAGASALKWAAAAASAGRGNRPRLQANEPNLPSRTKGPKQYTHLVSGTVTHT